LLYAYCSQLGNDSLAWDITWQDSEHDTRVISYKYPTRHRFDSRCRDAFTTTVAGNPVFHLWLIWEPGDSYLANQRLTFMDSVTGYVPLIDTAQGPVEHTVYLALAFNFV